MVQARQKSVLFLVSARVASDLRICIFSFLVFFLLWNNVQSQCTYSHWPPLCFKCLFQIGVWTFCPNCEASLSHHTLCMGNLVWFPITDVHILTCWNISWISAKITELIQQNMDNNVFLKKESTAMNKQEEKPSRTLNIQVRVRRVIVGTKFPVL